MDSQQTKRRSWARAIARGFTRCCPACGNGRLFSSYLKVSDLCPNCSEPLHHHRADDIPPYFTILIVGHILVPLILMVESVWHPDLLLHLSLWLPATIILTLLLLPSVKGAVVGLQWAFKMGGFDQESPHLMDS